MEKSTGVAILIVIVILGVAGFFIYQNVDIKIKPTYSNLTISAEEDGKRVVTGYIIEYDDQIINGTTTLSNELQKIRDGSVKIYNENREGQNYYKRVYEFNITSETKRIRLDLKRPHEVEVKRTLSNPINITLSSKYIENLDVCLDWSLSYMQVKLENYTEIQGEQDCYNTKLNLKNDEETIQLSYKTFYSPSLNDYINITLKSRDLDEEIVKIVKIK